jgi:predicted transcriptional regulator
MLQSNGSDREFAETPMDDEDEATLAAIAEGIRAADEGRLVPADEVRELVKRWNSEFSAQRRR